MAGSSTAAAERTSLEVAGSTVSYQRAGSGAPLLFLHGANSPPGWLPFMTQLAERYDVIVPDHPGFGQSDTPAWLDNMHDLAYFYLDFIGALGLRDVHLVGNSLGGWLACEIAIRQTAPFKTLTLVAPAGIRLKGVRKLDIFLLSPEVVTRSLFADQSFADRMLAQTPTDEQLDVLLKNRYATARVAWQPRLYDPHLAKWMHRIDIPTLIVWGDSDKLIPPAYAAEFARLIPGAQTEIIANCGHLPQIEKTGEFLNLVNRFIERKGRLTMKFMLFHLMPYADLDLNYTEKHESAWVTLPGTYFDREKGHALYTRYLDELELGDDLGFDAIGVNEHHQNAYGLMPVPAVIAGALSRRIKGKLAVLGRALPLLNNPLVVAEEFAMLDQITGGRLIAGFVRGIGGEYHSWGANPTESHERFMEAHDLIVRAWTEPGPFAFEGKYYDFDYVNTWPRPYQVPHPPVWMPSTGSSETVAFAAQKRYTYLQTYSPVAAVCRSLDQYRAEAEKNGYTASPEQMGWMAPIYVAETDQRAYDEAKPHIEAFANKFLRKPFEMRLPPGYVSMKSLRGVMQAKASQTVDRSFDEVLAGGSVICGSVETVRRTLLEREHEMGHGWQLSLMQFGTLPSDLTRKSMELFATQVMPYVREHAGEGKALARA